MRENMACKRSPFSGSLDRQGGFAQRLDWPIQQ
jgi:hypothetical protein